MTRRALGLHLTLAIVLPGFAALTWWQVGRAISGNTLSYVYSFEWPLFAAYAVYLWWKLVHEAPAGQVRPGGPSGQIDATRRPEPTAGTALVSSGGHPGEGRGPEPVSEPHRAPVDDELAAYNRYLAELAASGQRKQLFSTRRSRRRSSKQKT
ncbi:MAG: hypothetical protein J2O38_02565 [Acidimicrobiales bacterium]|nr:hypothetical protein [Acidimicrobiales bacterium]